MARQCKICGKQAVTGNKVSHSNIKTKTRNHPNLQKVRAFLAGQTPAYGLPGQARRILVCSRCIRSGLVQKAA